MALFRATIDKNHYFGAVFVYTREAARCHKTKIHNNILKTEVSIFYFGKVHI